MAKLNINALNTMNKFEFVAILKDIFEHSPWVVERAFTSAPFNNVDNMHKSMIAQINLASSLEQIKLLRAHPQLADKKIKQTTLAKHSRNEQAKAKLNALNSSQIVKMDKLNEKYQQKFGFPFIIAVLEHSRASIFIEFEKRLKNSTIQEINNALEQVGRIAKLRLNTLFN